MWKPIDEFTPKDRPIVAWCVHDKDPYYEPDSPLGTCLTIYAAHVEGLSHVEDGLNVIEWGGAWTDSWEDGGGSIPDWWFQKGSEFEVAANPVMWFDSDNLYSTILV